MRDGASRTAVLTCQGRAVAHGRFAVDRFADPVAIDLLRDDERAVVEQVRAGAAPKGVAPRLAYEFVRGCASFMVPRTVAVDDAVLERPGHQVVILGAGLDARAWRLDALAGTVVLEVDHPASQRDKRQRLGDRAPAAGEVRFVPVDLARDDLGDPLAGAGHRSDLPTTWVWEGVVPYLTADQVGATVSAVAARSASGSRFVVNYQVPSGRAGAGQLLARAMLRLSRSPDPWRDEPHRSDWTPSQLAALLDPHGFTTTLDRDLAQIARTLPGPATPEGPGGSLPNGHVLVADLH